MDEVNNSVLDICIEKWGRENISGRIENIENEYNDWIKNFSPIDREVMDGLLKEFEYYGHQYVNRELKTLYKNLIEKYSIDNDETLYTFIKKSDLTLNSSYSYLFEFVMLNGISEKNGIVDISNLNKKQMEIVKNVVLIDDYSGTGESIIKYLRDNYELLKKKVIYFLLISISEGAASNIYKEFPDMKIIIETINIEKKASLVLNNLIEDVVEPHKTFENISISKGIKKDIIWGRNDTEALVSFYNNTPNNTLGIFWKETNLNKPLFPRKVNNRPGWMNLKREKQNRKLENANNFFEDVDG